MGMSRVMTETALSCQPAVTDRMSMPAASAVLMARRLSSGLLPPLSSRSSSPHSLMMIG